MLGFGIMSSTSKSRRTAVPTIQLSSVPMPEDASIGDLIGTFSVSDGTGVYTFEITVDTDSKFQQDGADDTKLEVGGSLNYEAATNHTFTVTATNGVDPLLTRDFTIPVTNVLEITLVDSSLDTANIDENTGSGVVVGAIQDIEAGATVTMIDDAGGKFSIDGSNNVITGLVPTDYDTAATEYVTIRKTHPDGNNSPKETVVAITVNSSDAADTSFKTTWRTTTPAESITLPFVDPAISFVSDFDCVVDWGDGSTSTITAWDDADKTHEYADAGDYVVSISGQMDSFAFAQTGDRAKLIGINNWGDVGQSYFKRMFWGCYNLEYYTATDSPIFPTGINLERFWAQCSKMNFDLSGWDFSNIGSLEYFMQSCLVYNQPVTNWDISGLNDANALRATFTGCAAFNQPFTDWVIPPAVTSMQNFLEDCDSFNCPLGHIDMSNIGRLDNILDGARAFNNTFPLDLSSCVSFAFAFTDCNDFNYDISSAVFSSSGCSFRYTFAQCYDYSYGFPTGAKATNLNYTFRNTVAFDSSLAGVDVTACTIFSFMFQNASLSTSNYDATLISWAAQGILSGKTLDFGSSKYTAGGAAEAARTDLITTYGATITDGGAV